MYKYIYIYIYIYTLDSLVLIHIVADAMWCRLVVYYVVLYHIVLCGQYRETEQSNDTTYLFVIYSNQTAGRQRF